MHPRATVAVAFGLGVGAGCTALVLTQDLGSARGPVIGLAFVALASALVFAVDASRSANAANTWDAKPTTTTATEAPASGKPVFGARVLEGHGGGKPPGQSWATRHQPWWVVLLMFAGFALAAGGFVHCGPTPVGFVVCRKARWEVRDTFDPRACFAQFIGQVLDDPEVRSDIDDARRGLDEAREELERVRSDVRFE